MRKFKCFIDYDKEEKWLNEMAKKGFQLKNAYFGYNFRTAKPQDTIIKIDYRQFIKDSDFIDYCTLFEDSGWLHISGSKCSGTQYFRKIDENSSDDIFSDSLSKASKYKRLSNMWLILALCYIPLFISLMFSKSSNVNIDMILHPKLLYYTPGLWELSGFKFWAAFLFETPFALGRGFSWLFFLIVFVFYFSFALKARILYKKNIKLN